MTTSHLKMLVEPTSVCIASHTVNSVQHNCILMPQTYKILQTKLLAYMTHVNKCLVVCFDSPLSLEESSMN